VHRDIKSANIFITKDKFDNVIYKIGDLNVSKVAK
jgi:serine/threonine protein kinase